MEIECGGVDWIHLGLDRDQWWVLVVTVMNLQIPPKKYGVAESSEDDCALGLAQTGERGTCMNLRKVPLTFGCEPCRMFGIDHLLGKSIRCCSCPKAPAATTQGQQSLAFFLFLVATPICVFYLDDNIRICVLLSVQLHLPSLLNCCLLLIVIHLLEVTQHYTTALGSVTMQLEKLPCRQGGGFFSRSAVKRGETTSS